MTAISFTIPGRLIGKGRPKFSAAPITRAYEAALLNLRSRCADFVFRSREEGTDPDTWGQKIQTLPLLEGGKNEKLGFVQVYTPKETEDAEQQVAKLARAAMGGRPPLEGAIWLQINAVLTPPPSWPKKKRAAAHWVSGKPDLDNMLKLVGDACNEICWADDAQIAAVFFARTYSLTADEAVKITFGELVDGRHEAVAFEGAPREMPLFAGGVT